MNRPATIRTYDELLAEKMRLETLLTNQRNIVRHDIDELKEQFKKEVRPAVETAGFLKQFLNPSTKRSTLFKLGASTAADLFFTSIFGRSTFFTRAIAPALIRNLGSFVFRRWKSKAAKFR